MSKFFINRPIVAIVVSILTVIVGVVCFLGLPVAQFPNIAPPEIQVKATYTGADALTIEQSVATPIEQQMSGVDNMNYMYSTNANNGAMTLTVDFDIKTNPSTDQILSQMRANQANSQLPSDVTKAGVTVQKSTASPLLLFAVYSPKGTRDSTFLANYCYININDQLTRVPGIASVTIFGAGQYAMRIWVKPDQLAKLGLTVPEIISAVQKQNNVNPAGQIGAEPVPPGQSFTYAVRAQGRLQTEEEFGDIVVRSNPDGSLVRLRDVGRIELGAQTYNLKGRLDGQPAALIAVYQMPGTNALVAADGAKKLMEEIKGRFPTDIDYVIALDTTKGVTEGMHEIAKTLFEALGLVILVVYLFLQGWRATLIPLFAVPVSLVGTFAIFPLLGFSINTLSLFGLVLAIGLVVDDAIVVVEAVERHIERGLAPRQAALKAMEEVSGPVIAIALILSAVFVPTAFIPGITGRLYQQFAITIAVSVLLSAFNALTLSPALAALLLRPKKEGGGLQQRFFNWFNHVFEKATGAYVGVSRFLIRKGFISVALVLGMAGVAGFLGKKLPSGFLPDEDQGYIFVGASLPDAASLGRTDEVCKTIEGILKETPGVAHYSTIAGFSLLSGVQNTYSAFFFVTLKDWDKRTSRDEQYQVIKAKLNLALSKIPAARAFAFGPPAIPGVGTSGGFTFILEDRSGQDLPFLTENVSKFIEAARKRPELAGVTTTFLPTVPQIFAQVDRDKALKQGVDVSQLYQTLQTFMGGYFINYFNRFGRQWQVFISAEGEYRTKAENVGQFYVLNNTRQMVPLSALTTMKPIAGPEFTMRYNLYRGAQINGNAAPGYSSGQAMAALEEVFKQTMPREMGFDYTGMSYQEQQAGKGVPPAVIFGLSLLFVFLILAAQYESWALPFSVLLCTPVAVFGAFGVLWLRRTVLAHFLPAFMVQIENNVYAQIGLVMLIGLAAKNAILIVEFAKMERDKGTPLLDATLLGAKLRLRPILMTSFAFILGCVPLWTATGSGSVSRQVLGTCVIGGMLASSFLAIFLIPFSFYIVEKWFGPKQGKAALPGTSGPPAETTAS